MCINYKDCNPKDQGLGEGQPSDQNGVWQEMPRRGKLVELSIYCSHTKKLFCSPIIPESVGYTKSEGFIFRTFLSLLHPNSSKVCAAFPSFIWIWDLFLKWDTFWGNSLLLHMAEDRLLFWFSLPPGSCSPPNIFILKLLSTISTALCRSTTSPGLRVLTRLCLTLAWSLWRSVVHALVNRGAHKWCPTHIIVPQTVPKCHTSISNWLSTASLEPRRGKNGGENRSSW